jgi:hypothetical protein
MYINKKAQDIESLAFCLFHFTPRDLKKFGNKSNFHIVKKVRQIVPLFNASLVLKNYNQTGTNNY